MRVRIPLPPLSHTGILMKRNDGQTENLQIDGFPTIRGLALRRYGGSADIPAMAEVITRSREADGVDYVTTEADLAARFDDPLDFNPKTDIVIVEAKGKIVGLARVWREDRGEGKRIYGHSVEILKNWRGRGIREALFRHNEEHIRRTAKVDDRPGPAFLELWANDSDNEWKSIVLENGYRPVQHEIDLIRSLDEIPDMRLPKGFEIRPVRPEHLDWIWEACRESMRKDWNYSDTMWDEKHIEAFKKTHAFQPDLWQVAWKENTLAGMILNYIVPEENREFNVKRGHTEYVYVREQYRGKGLARALLASSFKVLKGRGMDEAMLGMEIENPHDPLRLYQGMGFKVVRHFTWYHKPVA